MKKPEILKAQKYAQIFGIFNLIVGSLIAIILIVFKRYTEIGFTSFLFANAMAFVSISNLIKKAL